MKEINIQSFNLKKNQVKNDNIIKTFENWDKTHNNKTRESFTNKFFLNRQPTSMRKNLKYHTTNIYFL